MKKPAPTNPNSPWRRGPACDTGRAKASYIRFAANKIEAALSRQDAQPEDWGPSHKQPWHEAEDAHPEQQGAGDVPASLRAAAEFQITDLSNADAFNIRELARYAMDALAARQPVADQHPDDVAVDAFAAAMKAKMAAARAKGRGGWEDPAQCSAADLSGMLRDHVDKGDPRDVANFCMMLHQRGEAIAARQPGGVTAEWVLGYFATDAPKESRDAILNAFAEHAALNGSRQPVGQEPAGHGMFTRHGSMIAFRQFRPDGQYVFTVDQLARQDRETPQDAPHTGRLFYTGALAQVDLERYKAALERIAQQDTNAADWKHWREIAREALIDQQAGKAGGAA